MKQINPPCTLVFDVIKAVRITCMTTWSQYHGHVMHAVGLSPLQQLFFFFCKYCDTFQCQKWKLKKNLTGERELSRGKGISFQLKIYQDGCFTPNYFTVLMWTMCVLLEVISVKLLCQGHKCAPGTHCREIAASNVCTVFAHYRCIISPTHIPSAFNNNVNFMTRLPHVGLSVRYNRNLHITIYK